VNNASRPANDTDSAAWLGLALTSAASFAVMGACVRMAGRGLPLTEVVFFRNFIAVLMLLPLMIQRGVSLKTSRIGLHMTRSLTGLAAMYFYFIALSGLHLSDALLLNYTSPVFIAVFAVLWLKEEWTVPRRIALGLSLLGLLLLFHPSGELVSFAGLCGLASGALAGLALTVTKRLSDSEEPIRIVVWFALTASLVSALPLLVSFVPPSPVQWSWLLAVGLFGSLGQLTLTAAYRRAPVTHVAPLGYTALIFAAAIGFVAWGERPDLEGIGGMLLITAAGITVARRRANPAPQPPGGVPIIETPTLMEHNDK